MHDRRNLLALMKIETINKNDPLLYRDMETYLQSGDWQIAYDSPTALQLDWDCGWLHALAAFDLDEARQLLEAIPTGDYVVLRGCKGLRELAAEVGFVGCEPCWQAVYDSTEPVPVHTELTIRHPDDKDFPKVAASYELGTEEELRGDFDGPDFLGGYLGDEMVCYAGLHGEGSMGMLYVFPEYRRRGYAEAIFGTLRNNQLQKGRLPYAQIIDGNNASIALHRKLGFKIAEDMLYWMWRE